MSAEIVCVCFGCQQVADPEKILFPNTIWYQCTYCSRYFKYVSDGLACFAGHEKDDPTKVIELRAWFDEVYLVMV